MKENVSGCFFSEHSVYQNTTRRGINKQGAFITVTVDLSHSKRSESVGQYLIVQWQAVHNADHWMELRMLRQESPQPEWFRRDSRLEQPCKTLPVTCTLKPSSAQLIAHNLVYTHGVHTTGCTHDSCTTELSALTDRYYDSLHESSQPSRN